MSNLDPSTRQGSLTETRSESEGADHGSWNKWLWREVWSEETMTTSASTTIIALVCGGGRGDDERVVVVKDADLTASSSVLVDPKCGHPRDQGIQQGGK